MHNLPGLLTHFASHDAASLTARIAALGGTQFRAATVVRKVLRHVYPPIGVAGARGQTIPATALVDTPWNEATLSRLGIGMWAWPSLLALNPHPTLTVADTVLSHDGTIRLLLRTIDNALIESVLIPGLKRTTLCVSSQVGCARACTFCETGALGFSRQLNAAEIVDQVRVAASVWQAHKASPPLSNIVFMGMGEPFDNLSEVLRAIRLITDDGGLAFAPSRISVSTVGVADKLADFFAGTRAELAVSLNAPDDARRNVIMPINRRVPLAALRAALEHSLPPGRLIFFEYILFDGFNDELKDADLIAEWVRGLRCRVNVIPGNPGPDPALRPPREDRLEAFVARLISHGLTTMVRRPRGRDVGGACGQLAGARRLQLLGS